MDLADTRLGWRLVSPRMQELYPPITLGETAENVADKYGVTRERQDQWALRSHRLAAAARDAGRFEAETVPVTTSRGEVSQDEGINGGITLEELAASARPPATERHGHRRGNSSPLNDGGRRPLLMSADAVAGPASGRWPGTRAPPRPGCTRTTWGSGRCPR